MEYHKVRLGELDSLAKHHPVIATQHPELGSAILPQSTQADPDFPILFYGEEDGQLACFFCSFPDSLTYGDTEVPWAWCGNLMTFPAFRRRGLAQALVEEQLAEFDRSGHVWGGVFSAAPALRLYEKLSFTMVGMAPRLCFVRNVTPFLKHHIPGVAAGSLGAISRVALSGIDRVLRSRQPWRNRTRLTEITPETLAKYLENSSPVDMAPARFDTTSSWILRRRDVRDIDRIMLVEDEADPVGYFLVRQRMNERRPIREKYFGIQSMTVMHYGILGNGPELHAKLLAAALDHFWSSDADLFEIITSEAELIVPARRAGLMPLGQGMSFKFKEPSSLTGTLPAELSKFKLTHYSGDAFSFE